MSFPTFNGAADEDAQEFLHNLEIACLVTVRDDDATRLCVFPLLMKAKVKVWVNTLLPTNRGDWVGLRVLFLANFDGGGETSESLWGKVKAEEEERGKSFSKDKGKAKVEDVDAMPIKKARQEEGIKNEIGERRMYGESSSKKKSKPRQKITIKDFALAGEDAQTFLDNLEIVCLVTEWDDDATRLRVFPLLMNAKAKAWFNTLLPANRGDWAGLRVWFLAKLGGGDQQELLSRITHQLEDLSVHLVRGGRVPPPKQEQARGPRRQAQEYHCYNCGENNHGMYYCPHRRRIGNFRGPINQVSPPRERQQQQPPFPIQQASPVQILRLPMQLQPQQPPPPPSPIAPIPPLPIPENRAVNVISLDAKVKAEEEERGKSFSKDKGKAKVEDVDAMPIKRARQEETIMSEIGERRKSGESSSKKKSKPRRPQLLHLAPKVRR
ncbi:hypothetical protein L7F22_031842 [Adiantum nelumboides]|nr:hypothetical protein [Adiantum nelumboides]